MANAPSRFKKVADALFSDKGANLGVVLGMLGRRRRDGVIQGNRHSFRDEDAGLTEFQPDLADGGGVIVAQHHIRPSIDHLTHVNRCQTGGTGQRFLGKGLPNGWER
jgi:hypothetical protein